MKLIFESKNARHGICLMKIHYVQFNVGGIYLHVLTGYIFV